MSDTINVLNQIVGIASKRGEKPTGKTDELSVVLYGLLEQVVESAGDCLEEHVAARNRAKPRKQRVYKEIVTEISALVGDVDMTCPEGTYYCVELIQELLNRYNIEEVKA